MSLRAPARLPVMTVIVVGVLTGCGTEPPAPTATTRSTAAPTSIPRLLDASRYAGEQTICQLLTNDQAARLGFVDDTPNPHSVGNVHSCTRDQSSRARASIVYYLDLSEDVLGQYRAMSEAQSEFASGAISGQPAVWYSRDEKTGPPANCHVILALDARQSVSINVAQFDSRNGCDQALAVAEEMVHNLGG